MELFPVPDVPEIREGDNLAALVSKRVGLRPDDVICVASTVISKAEGRFTDLDGFPASPRVHELVARLVGLTGDEKDPRLAQAVLGESASLVMSEPLLLTGTRFSHIGVNAGIDRSSVPNHDLLLLPKHPSESTERIRIGVDADRVIITDICGRPFQCGQRDVVIGWAGLSTSRDRHGKANRDGRELGVTVKGIVDELAATANPVQDGGDGGMPVVVVHDFEWDDHGESDAHFRGIDGDFVRQVLREWRYDL